MQRVFKSREFLTLVLLAVIRTTAFPASAFADEASTIVGRWDLVAKGAAEEFPSWLEVRVSGNSALVGSFVGQFGSARPISKVETLEDAFRFSLPPQWEKRTDDQVFTLQLQGDELVGETTDESGQHVTLRGKRAPKLIRKKTPRWGQVTELFNGKDLSGWKPAMKNVPNGWVVRDGFLYNEKPGNNLVTEEKFTDFRLQAEFRYPKGSNSGLYLRGRYELQIEDNYGNEPDSHKIGGVYGFLTPSSNACKPHGEWQTYDIELVGRVITVHLNGERIIDRQSIPGITGGALDSDEGSPGPIYIQGDHGPVEFRKLSIMRAE